MKINQDCKTCTNIECLIFNSTSNKQYEELNKNKTINLYKKNQQIFREENFVTGLFFIQKGKVKVYNETKYRTQIIRLAKDGDIIGHRGFGGNNRYPVSATTLEDSIICFVDQEVLFELLKRNPMLCINLMLFYATELREIETRLRNLAVLTVRERIADALLLINKTFGIIDKKNKKSYFLDVELSRKEIAEMAGTYAEQASRYIKEFEKDKILSLFGKRIIIHQPAKLTQIINKYDNSEFNGMGF